MRRRAVTGSLRRVVQKGIYMKALGETFKNTLLQNPFIGILVFNGALWCQLFHVVNPMQWEWA